MHLRSILTQFQLISSTQYRFPYVFLHSPSSNVANDYPTLHAYIYSSSLSSSSSPNIVFAERMACWLAVTLVGSLPSLVMIVTIAAQDFVQATLQGQESRSRMFCDTESTVQIRHGHDSIGIGKSSTIATHQTTRLVTSF
jgi:hypothetical protein